jgi:hypothetical protein
MATSIPNLRLTVLQAATLGGLNVATSRDWYATGLIRGEAGEKGEGVTSKRRLDFPAALHLFCIDRLTRYGVTPTHASEIIARYVDDLSRLAADEKGRTQDRAAHRLDTMVIRVHCARDGNAGGWPVVTSDASSSSHDGRVQRHKASDAIPDDACVIVLRVGPIVLALLKVIERAAAAAAPKGRA